MRIGERTNKFFQKQWIALPFELYDAIRHGPVVPDQLGQQFAARPQGQFVKVYLGILALAVPFMRVFRTIGNYDQDRQERNTVDEGIQRILAVDIEPMQILEQND